MDELGIFFPPGEIFSSIRDMSLMRIIDSCSPHSSFSFLVSFYCRKEKILEDMSSSDSTTPNRYESFPVQRKRKPSTHKGRSMTFPFFLLIIKTLE